MRLPIPALVATALAALGAAPASAVIKHPTPVQVRRAVRRAERSPAVWATVNICNTAKFPDTLGIRGQMPALGFRSTMSLEIQVEFFDTTKLRFVPVPAGQMSVPLGTSSTGLQQAGATFTFKPHTGLLRARVTFKWERAGAVLGQVTRNTTGGHPDADFGSPPHHSAARCRIS